MVAGALPLASGPSHVERIGPVGLTPAEPLAQTERIHRCGGVAVAREEGGSEELGIGP